MNRSPALIPTLLVLVALLGLSGCGNKGPLVLPTQADSTAVAEPAAAEPAAEPTDAAPAPTLPPPPPPAAGRDR